MRLLCFVGQNDEQTEKRIYLIWPIQLNQINRRFSLTLPGATTAPTRFTYHLWECILKKLVCVCCSLSLSYSLNDDIFISRKIVVSFHFSVWCARIMWILSNGQSKKEPSIGLFRYEICPTKAVDVTYARSLACLLDLARKCTLILAKGFSSKYNRDTHFFSFRDRWINFWTVNQFLIYIYIYFFLVYLFR